MLKYALLASTRCGAWSVSLFGCKDDISRVSCCVCPAGEATSSLTHGAGAGGTRSRTRGLLSPTLPLALLLPSHPMPTGSPLAPALSALTLPGVLSWGSCRGLGRCQSRVLLGNLRMSSEIGGQCLGSV